MHNSSEALALERKLVMSMTKAEAVHKVVTLAYDQVGYKEGPNNWNKYAADPRMTQFFGWNVQNQAWCNIFADWLPVDLFGIAAAREMVYGGSTACRIAAEQFQKNDAWFDSPEKGDQVFYYISGGINHVGTVVDVSGATLTTVEGNYQDGVCIVTHYINDPEIAGYGRPNWSVVADVKDEDDQPDDDPDQSDIIHPGTHRACFRLEYGDGCQWNKQKPLPQVAAWQNLLLCWGFDLDPYGADGEFGDDTLKATKAWQAKAKALGANVEENGIVDSDDWEEIIFVPTE